MRPDVSGEVRMRGVRAFGEDAFEELLAKVGKIKDGRWRNVARAGGGEPVVTELDVIEAGGVAFARVSAGKVQEDDWQITTTWSFGAAYARFEGKWRELEGWDDLMELVASQGGAAESLADVGAWIEGSGAGWCPRDAPSAAKMCGEGPSAFVWTLTSTCDVKKRAPREALDAWQEPVFEGGEAVVYAVGGDRELYRVEVEGARVSVDRVARGAQLVLNRTTTSRKDADADARYDAFLKG